MTGPMTGLSRRRLLGNGALVVAFALSPRAFAQQADAKLPGSLAKSPLLDSWIALDAQGHIRVFTGKAELGQGLKTALLQIVADELDLPASVIELVTADTARTPDEGVTSGSQSMPDSGTAIANAAANVRLLIREAAAQRWGIPVEHVYLRGGSVLGPLARKIAYGELAAGLSLHVEARPDVPRRPRGQRTTTALKRVDIPPKLVGGAAYLQDFRLPDMLHARVVRGPSEGTRLKQVDVDAVARLPGVERILRDGDFTAVVAADEWVATDALRRLQAGGWERTGKPLPAADLQAALRSLPRETLTIFETPGPPPPGDAQAIKARYSRPYLMHGAIGPSCAVALWKDDSLTVWTHSQGVYPLRGALAELLRLAPDKIRCVHLEGAGCYGHNGADDVAADAALVARALPGRPIRLQWTREQEHGWEPLGPAMSVDMEASVANGRIVAWRHEVWSNTHSTRPNGAGGLLAGRELDPPFTPPVVKPSTSPAGTGDRNAKPLYVVPNAHGLYHFILEAPLRVSALRALGAHMNVFANESFMDELARAAGADPVAFRLAHLEDARARDVIALAAERFDWKQRRRGSGFAFARYKNSGAYCAVALQASVERDSGRIRIGRVVAAVDSGEAISPDGIRNQIEGGIVQSLSWTIHEEVGFDARHRTSFDWSGYPILRFDEVPASVEVHVIDRPGQSFLGTGEAAQGPAAAALANAVADARGLRLRDLPLSPERVAAAFLGGRGSGT
jgi:nicotinate dehydrogenase subunit B